MGPRAEGRNEGEQPVRQSSVSGRGEYAPSRTREKDHLGALSKPAGGGSLQPEQIGQTAMRPSVIRTDARKVAHHNGPHLQSRVTRSPTSAVSLAAPDNSRATR